MKLVTMLAVVDEEKCTGCKTCYEICPTIAITMENKKAMINEQLCMGCGNCEQRCSFDAISLIKRSEPVKIGVNTDNFDQEEISKICAKTFYHPEQVVCFCTGTRAGEIAAAVLDGAKTPEEIAIRTGARTGCKVLCIQPILRILEAAGIKPEKPVGHQWCGRTSTIWDLSDEIIEKYSNRGFYFEKDRKFLEKELKKEVKTDG